MIQVRNVNTDELYVINEATLAYYEVGIYDRENGIETLYIEFFFNGERRLKFKVDAGLYENKEALEIQLFNCTRGFNAGIVVSGVL